ncbi:hypothetical protein PAPHI01_0132 [Pancytospora philotis]|nr:hypothetical protein PAPHI01_0132 [Pancytospora philotis]
MAWYSGLLSTKCRSQDAETAYYPSRVYRRILCSRQHCTEACSKPNYDSFKYWAVFLAVQPVNREILLINLSTLPDCLRFGMYRHLLARQGGAGQLPENEQFNRYFSSAGASVAKDKGEQEQEDTRRNQDQPDEQRSADYELAVAQSDDDSAVAREILLLIDYFAYDKPETVFRIYKALERRYQVGKDMLKVIIMLLNMKGSDPETVLCICLRLIQHHGLLDVIADDQQTDTASSEGRAADESTSDVSDKADVEEQPHHTPQTGSVDGNQSAQSAAQPIERGISNEDIQAIYSIIFSDKIDVFVQITDLVAALNCSYTQVVEQAAKFSQFSQPSEILTVLASRLNNQYYKDLFDAAAPPTPAAREDTAETYFDFLIIQNELIKAQENIKKELGEQIAELERENRRLVDEQKEMNKALAEMKEGVHKSVEEKRSA